MPRRNRRSNSIRDRKRRQIILPFQKKEPERKTIPVKRPKNRPRKKKKWFDQGSEYPRIFQFQKTAYSVKLDFTDCSRVTVCICVCVVFRTESQYCGGFYESEA